jgi:hypothetical protein
MRFLLVQFNRAQLNTCESSKYNSSGNFKRIAAFAQNAQLLAFESHHR